MIPQHRQFLDAIRERKLVLIGFYSLPDAGTVTRECVPLDYGAGPGPDEALNRYWIWDHANTAGTNPLGLLPDQIVSLQVMGKTFDPAALPLVAPPVPPAPQQALPPPAIPPSAPRA